MQEKLSRRKKYWICQFSGWGFYSVIYIFFGFGPGTPVISRFLLCTALFLLQILFTDFYRKVIIRNKWLDREIRRSIKPIIFSSVMLSILVESLFLFLLTLTSMIDLGKIPYNYLIIRYLNRTFANFAWSVIYFAFNYSENYSKAKIEKLWYEVMLRDSELQLLKSQMHPHFIFNAISSISGLINENPEKAQASLSLLSGLIRYSLNASKTETVLLEEEMQIVSDYLELESARFEERLTVITDIDKNTLYARIPPLLIQTLCEYNIKYGISRIPHGGSLYIQSLMNNNSLVIKIVNNGKLTDDSHREDCYEIKSTRQRLSLLYNDEASFDLKSISDGFILSEIKIPLREIHEYSDC